MYRVLSNSYHKLLTQHLSVCCLPPTPVSSLAVILRKDRGEDVGPVHIHISVSLTTSADILQDMLLR